MKVYDRIPAGDFEHASAGSPETLKRNGQVHIGFDAAATESMIYGPCRMQPDYDSAANLTLTLTWVAASATTGDVRWQVEVEYVAAGAFDIDADGFASAVQATSTTDATSGETAAAVFTLSNANLDSVIAKGLFRLKVSRLGADGADTMAGDAQLRDIVLEQA
jgi:hypothetical protein